MQKSITIENHPLPIREHRGHRVVTYRDIAAVHGVNYRSVKRNFDNNRKHFKEGADFFRIVGGDSHKFSPSSNAGRVNIFTETGYLMLVKSLTDDTAWAVQRELVNRYFKMQVEHRSAKCSPETQVVAKAITDEGRKRREATYRGKLMAKIVPLLDPVVQRVLFYRQEKGLTQEETARVLGVSRSALCGLETDLKAAGFTISRQHRVIRAIAPPSQGLLGFYKATAS